MPEAEQKQVPLGMREYYPYVAMRVADTLREQGVDIAFGVHGGHIWPMVDAMSNAGIKIVTVRHEQAGTYAAEAYSKVTNRVGVCFATVGPGVANTLSALQQAFFSCSPVVALYGGVTPAGERTYTIQPSYIMDLGRFITKWCQRLVDPVQYRRAITEAFKDAQTYPKGPIALEFTTLLAPEAKPVPRDSMYIRNWRGEQTAMPLPASAGDAELVEKAVLSIYRAERPVLYAGDGVHWSEASKELVEFAEMAQIPVCGRRNGRGAMPEVHPQSFGSQAGRPVLAEADLFIALGMKVGFGDQYGRGWPKRIIQINESAQHIFTFLPTELAIIGSPKLVLKQMIECAKANRLKPPAGRADWLRKVRETQDKGYQARIAKAMKYKDHAPVHFGYLAKAVWDVAEELYQGRNRVMIDGYTISDYLPAFIRTRYSGQIMDASEQAGVGHGVGMAIGAAFGDPEARKAPILAMMGDSGMGLAGMDCETAIRYNLPIVYIVTENGGWLTSMKYSTYGMGWEALGPQDRDHGEECLPNARYDKLVEVFAGGYAEHVEHPAQIRPALERACRKAEDGKTAIVNVKMDPSVANRQTYQSYATAWAHIPWDKLAPRARALRRNTMSGFNWEAAGVPFMPMPDPWEPWRPDEKWEPIQPGKQAKGGEEE